jgi:ribonuclease-3
MLQEMNEAPPAYEVISMTGADHEPTFRISVTAFGRTVIASGTSKKVAETEAAKMLIDELSKN